MYIYTKKIMSFMVKLPENENFNIEVLESGKKLVTFPVEKLGTKGFTVPLSVGVNADDFRVQCEIGLEYRFSEGENEEFQKRGRDAFETFEEKETDLYVEFFYPRVENKLKLNDETLTPIAKMINKLERSFCVEGVEDVLEKFKIEEKKEEEWVLSYDFFELSNGLNAHVYEKHVEFLKEGKDLSFSDFISELFPCYTFEGTAENYVFLSLKEEAFKKIKLEIKLTETPVYILNFLRGAEHLDYIGHSQRYEIELFFDEIHDIAQKINSITKGV